MVVSIDDTVAELRTIARNAKVAMQDPLQLLNTDLQLNKFDELFNVVSGSLDDLHTQRDTIIKQEIALRKELQQLCHNSNLAKSALESIAPYEPKYPKRYKVMPFSL